VPARLAWTLEVTGIVRFLKDRGQGPRRASCQETTGNIARNPVSLSASRLQDQQKKARHVCLALAHPDGIWYAFGNYMPL
jgi:hypothetical protein